MSASRRTVLVTGGLGYIGSHTIVELMLCDPQVDIIALDNLSNSSIDVIKRIEETVRMSNRTTSSGSAARLRFVEADVTDENALHNLFRQSFVAGAAIEAVIHFAALKSNSESIQKPLQYYQGNVVGLLNLLSAMHAWQCQRLIFSSSATVYGSLSNGKCEEVLCRHNNEAQHDDISDGIQGCAGLSSPYARTKWMCEAILDDYCQANPECQAIALRYFNPVGAHHLGLLKETPLGRATNLIPSIVEALQSNERVSVFGDDYNTRDGSAVRDYIHVMDLAEGHVAALHKLYSTQHAASSNASSEDLLSSPGIPSLSPDSSMSSENVSFEWSYSESELKSADHRSDRISYVAKTKLTRTKNALDIYNLGTGCGSTVKEVVAAMSSAYGFQIPYDVAARRAGDIETSVAHPAKANAALKWKAQRTMAQACVDVFRALRHTKIE